MIIVLFGQPHSGKTTLAKILDEFINIDGDELRKIFKDQNYSREGRIKNLNRASDIAVYLHSIGHNVVLSLVYPYKEARDHLNSLCKDVKWFYLTYQGVRGKEQFHAKDFEIPTEENVIHIDTSGTIEDTITQILVSCQL